MVDNIRRRNTQQRQIILEELRKLDTHPTASDLYELARARLPRLSLGTVYRNLELLVEMGLAKKMETSGAEARFDGNVGTHYHIRCVRCGSVADAHGVTDEPVRVDMSDLAGYEILGYHLEFEGVCPSCREAATSGPRPATN